MPTTVKTAMTGGKKQITQTNVSGEPPTSTASSGVVDGDILLAAATCSPAAVIEDLFKTLLSVRQAEFEAQEGVNNPDAWDTSVVESGVAVDLDRQLDGIEFGSAYARWRQQWVDRITLHLWQEEARQKLSHAAFARKVRSWFEAWLDRYLGNRHVARAVIHHGTSDPAVVANILEAIEKEKEEEVKKRKLQDESHGAGEPVWKLKLDAHLARKALRDGERLAKKLLDWLPHQQKELLEEFHARRLHVRVDRAHVAYGHGIARTHDFGFQPGENMCRDVPIELRAHLLTWQSS